VTTTDHLTQSATTDARDTRDLRRTWRRVAALALVAGPLGVTVIRLVMPYWTDDAPAQMVAGFAADPGAGVRR
jgi:hypothetical protein